jgi:hypothetical protein
MLSATQLQKGWSTLKHSEAPLVLGAELPVYVVLAVASLALLYRRGTEARSVVFTGALFGAAAV